MFLICLVSLTVIGTGLSAPSKSGAEPAPVFRPLIDDIRSQLPQGLKIRLPSSLPSPPPNVRLYPYILSDNKVFGVNLAVTPNCSSSNHPSSCTVGGLGVFTPDSSKVWPPKGDNVTPVDLRNGIRGFYLTRGNGNSTNKYVFWQQDGLEYTLGVGGGASKEVSQQQMIDMAISAVNEPPITSPK